MKRKLLTAMVMAVMVVSISACGTSQSNTTSKNDKDDIHNSKIEATVETTVEDVETEDDSDKEVIFDEDTSKIEGSALGETVNEKFEEDKDEKVEMEGHGHKDDHSIDSSDNNN